MIGRLYVFDPQQWIMNTSWIVNAKDDEGFPAFSLVNKATDQALRHGRAKKDKVSFVILSGTNEALNVSRLNQI